MATKTTTPTPTPNSKDNIQRKTLLITGLCARIQRHQIDTNHGLDDIVTVAHEVDQHVERLNTEHKTEKTRLAMKNRDLAKHIHNLRKQGKDLQKELAETRRGLIMNSSILILGFGNLGLIKHKAEEEQAGQ